MTDDQHHCEKLGFRVPRSYLRMLEVARELSPSDPWNAFDRLHLLYLDDAGPAAVSYTAPPDFVVFGWTGTDSGHYGFVLDDADPGVDERPVALNYPDGTGDGLLALTLPDFLGQLCAPYDEQDAPDPHDAWEVERRRLATILRDSMGVVVPPTQQRSKEAAWAERLRRGAVPTEDRIGVMLPRDVVDRRYLDGLRWREPDALYSFEKPEPDERRLDEADRRLRRGEVGTALVVARNFRFHYWYDDWKTSRAYVRRTCEILEAAYSALGRGFAARAVRRQTDRAIAQVI